MSCMKEARYFPGEAILETENLKKPRENDVRVLEGGSPSSPRTFGSFTTFSIQALPKVDLGEELPVRLENKYKFHEWSRT